MFNSGHGFEIEVPAKWILTGEHSVLRGRHALSFPYFKFNLTLNYRVNERPISFASADHAEELKKILDRAHAWLLERSYILKPDSALLTGEISIRTTIPVGAGLGSSAALCVAVSRFCFWKFAREFETLESVIDLATYLEDDFHGKSSGLDVHTVALKKPIVFCIGKPVEVLKDLNLPRFQLHDTGLRGSTKECIIRVQNWRTLNPKRAIEVDEDMALATEAAVRALNVFSQKPAQAEIVLAEAMMRAQSCFEAWGLVPDSILQQKEDLLKKGAIAVKLTGAGLGGFWVALYRS